MILTGFKAELVYFLRNIIWFVDFQAKSWKEIWKNLKNCSKIVNKSLFFPHFGKKSFLNQTTYVLKNQFYPQSFFNKDSFLNQASLNRDSTVQVSIPFTFRCLSKAKFKTEYLQLMGVASFFLATKVNINFFSFIAVPIFMCDELASHTFTDLELFHMTIKLSKLKIAQLRY